MTVSSQLCCHDPLIVFIFEEIFHQDFVLVENIEEMFSVHYMHSDVFKVFELSSIQLCDQGPVTRKHFLDIF